MIHFLPQFSCCKYDDWSLIDGQGGQLTPRAVPRLRGGLPWREEADFDTFYMAFRFDLGAAVFVGGGVGYGKGAVGGVEAFDVSSPTFVSYIFASKPSGDLFFPNSTFQQVLSNKLLMTIIMILIIINR